MRSAWSGRTLGIVSSTQLHNGVGIKISKEANIMERNVINPWTWQDAFGFVQANQLTGAQRSLICAGQTSVDENGSALDAGDMNAQLSKCLDNLVIVLSEDGFNLSDVACLNNYTTDVNAIPEAAEMVLRGRFAESGCRPASA